MKAFRNLLLCLTLFGCNQEPNDADLVLFTPLSPDDSGIDFNNYLEYTETFNTYTYRNFYNGAGVAVGDINNDGWLDIYFSGNQVDNKLFLNNGDFTFQDITSQAGVACMNVWSTGVSMADINGDGLLDIYVCKSGPDEGTNRYNELFINNGDLTFSEKAQEYGIADRGLSNHAAFFDYDKDGDLDMYLLNNSMRSIGVNDLIEGQRNVRDTLGGNKLYRNDGQKFTDVSELAGIYGSAIGFGLGVTVADINKDGWQDIFVSNDFFERDYLYINNGDGTFDEKLESYLSEISMGSMGADIADINNDGYPEIYVTDMLPENDARIKSKTQFESWDKYALNIKKGYHHQFTRNVLQLNHGVTSTSSEGVGFSEIGRFAGIHATDWSWGALIMDVNNDGFKDIFVANGIYKDITDQDYINYYANNSAFIAQGMKDSLLLTRLIDAIPSNPIANYLFINNGDLTFSNEAQGSGMDQKLFSNGAAYADLDNDGDLDLVINNINAPALLLRNNANEFPSSNYIQLELKGKEQNRFALGAQVSVYINNQVIYQEQNPVKGYLSSVDHRMHIGLGAITQIDSISVLWPGGSMTSLKNVAVNQMISLEEGDSVLPTGKSDPPYESTVFKEITDQYGTPIRHTENDFVDFDRDRLLLEMISTEGPHAAVADVNGDQLDDIYLGGSKGYPGQMFLQTKTGFRKVNSELFKSDKQSEDMDAIFFDAEGDGDVDLYVASGSNEFPSNSSALIDRLYLNQGDGIFTKSERSIPISMTTTSFVKSIDYNKDGYTDLIVGTRLRPFLIGVPVNVLLLENNGQGIFKDVSATKAPEFSGIGMTTDAAILDYDNDKDDDVIIVGDWMTPILYTNNNGAFTISEKFESMAGLWNTIEKGDFNNDGYMDLVLGNQGLNNRFQATVQQPMTMYINDFDQNGSAEQIICAFNGEKSYPLTQLSDLIKQIPVLKKKYQKFSLYEEQTINDIFTPAQLQNAIELKVTNLATTLLINDTNGGFEVGELPVEVQFAPVYAISVNDYDHDGHQDILMGGNLSQSKPEVGIYKGSHGIFLRGNGEGQFTHPGYANSGIYLSEDLRDIQHIKIGDSNAVIFANNNSNIEIYKY